MHTPARLVVFASVVTLGCSGPVLRDALEAEAAGPEPVIALVPGSQLGPLRIGTLHRELDRSGVARATTDPGVVDVGGYRVHFEPATEFATRAPADAPIEQIERTLLPSMGVSIGGKTVPRVTFDQLAHLLSGCVERDVAGTWRGVRSIRCHGVGIEEQADGTLAVTVTRTCSDRASSASALGAPLVEPERPATHPGHPGWNYRVSFTVCGRWTGSVAMIDQLPIEGLIRPAGFAGALAPDRYVGFVSRRPSAGAEIALGQR
jgi:hypothetical protein